MRFSQNATIRRCFTAFFATLSLLGQGLHFFPGLGHGFHGCGDCCQSSANFAARHSPSGSCSHHHHASSGHQQGSEAVSGKGPGWQSRQGDGHECPICQFLAKARLTTATAQPLISTVLPPVLRPVMRENFTGRDSFEPHAPRGPPIVTAMAS
jgi:hypothetical protein